MITSVTNQGQNGTLGTDLARLRLNAGLKQARVAELLGVDTSRVSRIETGELLVEAEEATRVADAIGTNEAKDYATFATEIWTAVPKPSFWHPSRKELRQAEMYLSALDQFLGRRQTAESAMAQGDLYRKTILDAADYLRRLDHFISFVGEIGVGKSTAICGLTNLLLPPDPKAQTALSRRVVLEAGSGRMTLCEVQVRSEGKTAYGLVVQPQSQEEIFRMVSDFCASLVDILGNAGAGAAGDGESRGVPEELSKAIRNMAGLGRKTEKGADGRTVRTDPAMDLARECKEDLAELTGEVLKRIGLEKRTRTEFRFETESRVEGLQRLKELFASVNKGLAVDVSLPRRIDMIVPAPLLGKRPFTVRIVDTKGVDETAIRPDIRAYLDDGRTLTVLCTRFNSAPDSKVQQLLENLVSTGSERAMNERVVVLVLARSEEVMDTQDDTGNRAESTEEGYRIKGDQVRWSLSKLKGAKSVPVLFFDVLNDDHQTVADQIALAVEGMRAAQVRRIGEAGSAIDELIKRYGEAQTKEAQDEVRRRLRIFIAQHLELASSAERAHRSLTSAVRSTHARTVWATTRRKGGWPGLDAYHWLGVGTAEDAQRRSQPVLSGIDELLGNMLGDEKLEPARDYLNEIRRTIPAWREEFLKDATASGREIFRAELFLDNAVWDECENFWGGGSGYRDRVAQRLSEWFDSHGHLQASVEKRVQSGWRSAFLTPLATLCTSMDLLPSIEASQNGLQETASM
jgi:transcriptional regulator with XRE-family HTH domain